MFAPVSFVVRKRGHDPEVDLREGHLLEGTAREAEYEKCLTCFDFFFFYYCNICRINARTSS